MPTPDCQGPGEPDFKRKGIPKRVTRQRGAEKALRPPACRETLPGPGKGIARLGGNRKRDPRFPRPCRTLPRRPAGPGPAEGQRPTRRARSARQGRGGRWPGALGPRLIKDQRGAGTGAMAPAIAAVKVLSSVLAGSGNAARFPRPRATVPCRPAGPGPTTGQRPTRRGRSARQGRGGRWPGAFAPGWSSQGMALWQGRRPLPGCARRAQPEEVPAFRSGNSCDRHFFRPCQPPTPAHPSISRDCRPRARLAQAAPPAGCSRSDRGTASRRAVSAA